MKLSDYRVEAGVYEVGEYRIYHHGGNCWSLRCPGDSIIDYFATVRQAIKCAETLIQPRR